MSFNTHVLFNYIKESLNDKVDIINVYTKDEIDDKLKIIIGAAPTNLDSLEHIATSINNDPNFTNTIDTRLNNKLNNFNPILDGLITFQKGSTISGLSSSLLNVYTKSEIDNMISQITSINIGNNTDNNNNNNYNITPGTIDISGYFITTEVPSVYLNGLQTSINQYVDLLGNISNIIIFNFIKSSQIIYKPTTNLITIPITGDYLINASLCSNILASNTDFILNVVTIDNTYLFNPVQSIHVIGVSNTSQISGSIILNLSINTTLYLSCAVNITGIKNAGSITITLIK